LVIMMLWLVVVAIDVIAYDEACRSGEKMGDFARISSTTAFRATSLRASSSVIFCAFLPSWELPSLKGAFPKGDRPDFGR